MNFHQLAIRVKPFIPTSFKHISFAYSTVCRTLNAPCSAMNPKLINTFVNSKRYLCQEIRADQTVDFDYVKTASKNDDTLIIDVREPEEVKELGQIPNSINIPLGSVIAVLSTVSDKEFNEIFDRQKPSDNTEIIFYCMIGKRSGKAQQDALSLGFKNAKNYLGSWTDWASKTK